MNCTKNPIRSVSKMQGLLFILLCWCFMPLQVIAADNVILWQTYHRPPGNIKSGQHAGQGFVQLVLEQVIQNLPEYIHKQPITTLARALEDMKLGKNACHPSLFKSPEREQYMVFSQASLFNHGNHVITRKAVSETLPPGPVELSGLVKESKMTFVSIKGRSFGTYIDNQLAGLNKHRVVEIPSDSLSVMFRLLAIGRIDITIAYPFELEYFAQYEDGVSYSLELLPIAGLPKFLAGNIACSNTEWGQRAIKHIDKVLTRIKPTKEYKQAMTRWWPKSSLDEDFENYYQNVFLNQ